MPYTLGKPDCPKCKGKGVVAGEERIMYRPDGTEIKYPTVYRCSCLEAKQEASAPPIAPDAQKRAAGDREDEE